MNSRPQFNSLPEEILVKIFAQLEKEDFNAISEVCKLWKSVTENHFYNTHYVVLTEFDIYIESLPRRKLSKVNF